MKMTRAIMLCLAILMTACPSAVFADPGDDIFHLFLPDKSWSLDVGPFAGFGVIRADFNKDMTGRMLILKNREKDIALSIFMEKAPMKGDSRTCRDYYWEKERESAARKEEVKFSEAGDMAVTEYIVRSQDGLAVRRNIDAFISRDGIWIDIHIIKEKYSAADNELLLSLLKQKRFTENYKLSPLDYYFAGNAFYLRENFGRAASYFEKIPLIEEKGSDKNNMQRSIMSKLGNAYRRSGNVRKSLEIFEKGTEFYPGYPPFYYGLAQAYADMNDLENAMANLHRAFLYKQNIGPMPDPAEDPAFEKFMSNENFTAFLKALKK